MRYASAFVCLNEVLRINLCWSVLLIGIFVASGIPSPVWIVLLLCNPRRILEALEQQFANRQLIEPIFFLPEGLV